MRPRLAAALLIALALPARGQFVQPEGSRFHNGSTQPLQDDGRAAPLLQKLQASVDRGEVDETLALLAALRALPVPALMPWGTRLHVPALERAARLLLEPGREPLAQAVLAAERAALRRAADDRDLPALLDRAARGAALPSAREAALLAARLLFEEGRFEEAAGLCARARGVTGADELLAAARRRLPPPPPAPDVGPRGLLPQHAGALPMPEGEAFGQPFVGSVPGQRLVVLESGGLRVLERATLGQGSPTLGLLAALQARTDQRLYPPLPVRHVAVPAGGRWVLPVDPLTESSFASDPSGLFRSAFLVGVDVGRDARLAWATPLAAAEDLSVSCGPPLVLGSRVYAQVFRTETVTDVSLVCLDLSDGRLLWETPLCSAAQVALYDVRYPFSIPDTRAVDVAPAARDGVLWCCTGYGIVAAVDPMTGTPLFTFRYDRVYPQNLDTWDAAFLWETGGWDDEPVRFWGDRVVVAPRDSRFLYMLAAQPGPRGQLILDDPIERMDRMHVVGLRPDPQGRPSPAVLCTRRSRGAAGLVLLGSDGHVLQRGATWSESHRLTGRPLDAGARALVPTEAGLLDVSTTDLSEEPRDVGTSPGVPDGVSSVLPLDIGAATVSPAMGRSGGFWVLQWYQPAP